MPSRRVKLPRTWTGLPALCGQSLVETPRALSGGEERGRCGARHESNAQDERESSWRDAFPANSPPFLAPTLTLTVRHRRRLRRA